MALTYEPFDTITVSKVNEKLGGGVEKLNQELDDLEGKIPTNIYNPNLLANWDFANIINTTGVTSWTLPNNTTGIPIFNGYKLTRDAAVTNNPTIELIDAYYPKLTNTTSAEAKVINYTCNTIRGYSKTYTFSVLVEPYGFTPDENSYIFVLGQKNVKNSNYEDGLYTLTFATDYQMTSPIATSVGITLGVTGIMYIKGMKLEEGPNQTLCHKNSSGGDWIITDPFDFQIELAKLSQWKMGIVYGIDSWQYIGSPLLALSGGTMTGPINMGKQKITNLADGTNDADAVNLGQLNNAIPIGRLYSVIFRSAQQTTTSITDGLYMMVINAIFGDTVLVYDEHGNDVTNMVKERSVMAPIRAIAPGFGSLSCQTHIEETSNGKLQLDVTCILTENPGSQGFVGNTIWIGYL